MADSPAPETAPESASLPLVTSMLAEKALTEWPIHWRMAAVLATLPAIGKNQRNKEQDFMFRGVDDVLNALNPILAEFGVFYVPEVLERVEVEPRITGSKKNMYVVNLHVRFRFYGLLGDYVDADAWGEGTDMGDKATNKAMTGAQKYALFQAFCIATKDQNDTDSDRSGAQETGAPEPTAAPAQATAEHVERLLQRLRGVHLALGEQYPPGYKGLPGIGTLEAMLTGERPRCTEQSIDAAHAALDQAEAAAKPAPEAPTTPSPQAPNPAGDGESAPAVSPLARPDESRPATPETVPVASSSAPATPATSEPAPTPSPSPDTTTETGQVAPARGDDDPDGAVGGASHEPGSVNKGKLNRMGSLSSEIGLDRDERIKLMGLLFGRPISTGSELSEVEGSALIDCLRLLRDEELVIRYLGPDGAPIESKDGRFTVLANDRTDGLVPVEEQRGMRFLRLVAETFGRTVETLAPPA